MSVCKWRPVRHALARGLLWAVCVALALVAMPPARAAACPVRSTLFAGVAFGHLPSGLGRRSDFRYHFAGVHFVAAVWERGPNASGGYRESLDAVVMHGPRLVGPRALHDWYLHYQQRPARDCRYRRVRIHGHHGWTCRDQVFWLMRPGLAVSVQLDRRWWGHGVVLRIAQATHRRRAADAAGAGHLAPAAGKAEAWQTSPASRIDTTCNAFSRPRTAGVPTSRRSASFARG